MTTGNYQVLIMASKCFLAGLAVSENQGCFLLVFVVFLSPAKRGPPLIEKQRGPPPLLEKQL